MISADSTNASITGEMFLDAKMADLLSDRAFLQAMLDFEAALARVEASCGVIPAAAVETIAAACDAALYDMAEIGRCATLAGNPALPMVQLLTAEVARRDAAAAEHVHFGATSQDVVDSALGQMFAAALALVVGRVAACCAALAKLAERGRAMPMAGRTVMQQALPIPFGLKAANWLAALLDSLETLEALRPGRVQFGGAAGTLAALGDKAAAVSRALSGGEEIAEPSHTNRAQTLRLAAELGILVSSLGKIARDVMLMMQTEVGEAFEPSAPGKGGSSTMPHKRNPVQALAIAACATRAPGLVATMLAAGVQEHERAAGGWQAEWDTMRQLFGLAGAASLQAQTLLEGLELDEVRMRDNLDITGGLLMAERIAFALAPAIGKGKAKALLDGACKTAIGEKRHLREVLSGLPEMAGLDLDALFEPTTYFGAADSFIDRILARHEAWRV